MCKIVIAGCSCRRIKGGGRERWDEFVDLDVGLILVKGEGEGNVWDFNVVLRKFWLG